MESGARFTPPETVTNLDPWEDCLQLWGDSPTKHSRVWPSLTLNACKIQPALRCTCTVTSTASESGSSNARVVRVVRVQVCRALRCVPAARYHWVECAHVRQHEDWRCRDGHGNHMQHKMPTARIPTRHSAIGPLRRGWGRARQRRMGSERAMLLAAPGASKLKHNIESSTIHAHAMRPGPNRKFLLPAE